MENLESGYYVINGTKRVLYWDDDSKVWKLPVKDQQKRLGSLVYPLDKQPKIKSIIPVEQTEYANIYKPY